MKVEFNTYVTELLVKIQLNLNIENIKEYLIRKEEFGVSRIEYENITIMYTTNKRFDRGSVCNIS